MVCVYDDLGPTTIMDVRESKPYHATEYDQYFDFNRLHSLCGIADSERIKVGSFEFKKIRRYFCILQTIFRILGNVVRITNEEREKIVALEEDLDVWSHGIEKKIREAESFEVSFEDLRKLDGFYSVLMKIRQDAGFGFPLQRFKSAKQRVEGAFSD